MTRSAAGGSPGLVLASITDGPQAPEVARRAADLATDHGQVLVLVAVPAVGWSTDASLIAVAQRRRQRDAAAVAGRVAPALDAWCPVEVAEHLCRQSAGRPAAGAPGPKGRRHPPRSVRRRQPRQRQPRQRQPRQRLRRLRDADA